jgi:hypothetical protein
MDAVVIIEDLMIAMTLNKFNCLGIFNTIGEPIIGFADECNKNSNSFKT